MTISRNSQPDEVGSTVVDIDSQGIDQTLAVDGLVDRNYASVYRYAYRLAGCASAAEDIAQDVFVKAIAHLHQLRERAAERGWLMSITRREFMRWLREVANPARGRPVALEEENVLTDDGQIQRLDNVDWVQSALCLLNEDARVALLMYYFEELSYAEIAQQLQIPIGTVMSRLSRGREHLRHALERTNQSARPADQAARMEMQALLPSLGSHAATPHGAAKPPAQEAKHG